MRGKRGILSLCLIGSLFCCSCGVERTAGEAVESKQTAEEQQTAEQTAEEQTVEASALEQPEAMPVIVFFLRIEINYYKAQTSMNEDQQEEEVSRPRYYISFFDNLGNLYTARDSYFDDMTDKEIYDEFAAGRLEDYLTLDTTCDLDELRENYTLIKSVAEENEELWLITKSGDHGEWIGNRKVWSAFYYNEDGNLSWIEFQLKPYFGNDAVYRADDERVDRICEWFEPISGRWQAYGIY